MSGQVGDAWRSAVRAQVAERRFDDAWRTVRTELLSGDSTAAYSVARNVLSSCERAGFAPAAKRRIRLAVLCTFEAAELASTLRIACLAQGIDAQLYVAPYGQVEQELLGPGSGLARHEPTHVLLAPTTADLGLPELAPDGDAQRLAGAAADRWPSLWVRRDFGATVIQHGFVVPDESPVGHLSMRLPGSRVSLVREVNRRLAERAGSDVLLVDCERLAARIGKRHWIDPRLWFAARQPFGAEALGLLARETAAVLAAQLGLAARCLVLDLDNTLWGGIVGEDGLHGIEIGEGPAGEAYAAFQGYVKALAQRGVVLAVASKNDRASAEEPFRQLPAMRLKLDDFAIFVADWRPKSEQIAEISETLGLGLDALVFVDDNPAECAEVDGALPDVTTICLDGHVSERVRTLTGTVRFESAALSKEDSERQRSYAARAQASELRRHAATIDEFLNSLEMRARVRRLDDTTIDRAAQLTQKTNQFNLTLRRHTRAEIERIAADPQSICRTLELDDRYASHGIIGLGFAVPAGDEPLVALIDTLLLSCRVIGRTAEMHLLAHLSSAAIDNGFIRMRGVYVPGQRNSLVADLYPRLGFEVANGDGDGIVEAGGGAWEYDLSTRGPIRSSFIKDEA